MQDIPAQTKHCWNCSNHLREKIYKGGRSKWQIFQQDRSLIQLRTAWITLADSQVKVNIKRLTDCLLVAEATSQFTTPEKRRQPAGGLQGQVPQHRQSGKGRQPPESQVMMAHLFDFFDSREEYCIVFIGAFISIFSNQLKAPQGWKLWSLLPMGAT